MADKITFDFETGQIFLDMPGNRGELVDSDLKDKKAEILAAAGIEQVDIRGIVNIFNDFVNGKIDAYEAHEKLVEECKE